MQNYKRTITLKRGYYVWIRRARQEKNRKANIQLITDKNVMFCGRNEDLVMAI